MSYLRMLKLLYIADRESLSEAGRPIIGTKVVAMKHGPLHSIVLDLVKGQHVDEPLWSEFIEKEAYDLRLVKDPGVGSLSRYEVGKLTEVCERYRALDDWTLADMTHEFEEWKRNYQENTSTTIPLEHILEAVGRSGDLEAILQDAKDAVAYEHVFGQLGSSTAEHDGLSCR